MYVADCGLIHDRNLPNVELEVLGKRVLLILRREQQIKVENLQYEADRLAKMKQDFANLPPQGLTDGSFQHCGNCSYGQWRGDYRICRYHEENPYFKYFSQVGIPDELKERERRLGESHSCDLQQLGSDLRGILLRELSRREAALEVKIQIEQQLLNTLFKAEEDASPKPLLPRFQSNDWRQRVERGEKVYLHLRWRGWVSAKVVEVLNENWILVSYPYWFFKKWNREDRLPLWQSSRLLQEEEWHYLRRDRNFAYLFFQDNPSLISRFPFYEPA